MGGVVTERFSIGLDPERTDEDGKPLGIIVIGSFTERFGLALGPWSTADYERQWTRALAALVESTAARVALMTWSAPPDVVMIRRAWMLRREGDVVSIQENLFIPGEHEFEVADDGSVIDERPWSSESDDGEQVSEWTTTVAAIRAFLGAEGN